MNTRQETIYADYQATTPIDSRVLEQMCPYWEASFGNPHSAGHIVGWRAAAAVEEAQGKVARLVGADADEIVFTSGATEANNLAILGSGRRASSGRRRVLVSSIEHKCVLEAARYLRDSLGFALEHIPVDSEGFVDRNYLESRLGEDVLLVSIMAANNEVGTIQDVPALSKLISKCGAIFHCDAAQAPAAMDVSELASHADLISLSSHKIYGPQGIGILVVRRVLQDRLEPLLFGGGQQQGLRSGTLPLPLCVGLGAAAEIVASPEATIERRCVGKLRDQFVENLVAAGVQVTLNGPRGEKRHPGNANLRFQGIVGEDLLGMLQPCVAASSGAACASGIPESSHVLRAMGLSGEDADSSLRFSFGRFSTVADIQGASSEVLKTLRRMV